MASAITCYPPLGATHVVDHGASFIRFVVGVPGLNGTRVRDVSIWHNCTPARDWSQLDLAESTAFPLLDTRPDRRYFTGAIPTLTQTSELTGVFNFTIKFRLDEHAPWLWIRDVDGSEDGEIVVPSRRAPSSKLSSYLDGVSFEVATQELAPTARVGLPVWELTAHTPASQDRTSGHASYSLGKPVDSIRWFAIVRHNDAWFGPRHGREAFSLKEQGVMLSFLRRDGLHVVLIAVSGIQNLLTTFVSNEHGEILVSSRNDGLESVNAHVFVAVANTCEEAVAGAMGAARNFVRYHRGSVGAQYLQQTVAQEANNAANFQDWYDGFAYCTWNGLGQYLSPSKIIDALTSLHQRGVRLTTLIIDDNWQSVQLESGKSDFYRQWCDFEANKQHFPGGLNELIAMIKSRFPYVRFIAVWHGIFGHWGGMANDGKLAKVYAMRTFKRREGIFLGGGTMTTVDGNDAERLYDDFYKFLADAGVDGVKVDTQSFLDYGEHADDRLALTTAYQDAWRLASLKYFGGRAIACMAQIPQTISHSWHIFCNAHNALLMQHFHLLPDWDMFQTKHQFSRFHAAARCVSGGPIYITDAPDEHDLDLIEQMTARTPDGRLIVLRTEKLGRTVDMYSSHSETQFLQIRAAHREAVITAVFNLQGEPRTKLISLGSVHTSGDEGGYLFRTHSSGRVVRHPASPANADLDLAMMELRLEAHDCDIITRYPVHRFQQTEVAVMGLLGKMSGAAAVISATYTMLPETSEVQVDVQLRALGTLGVYVSVDSQPLAGPVRMSVGGGIIFGIGTSRVSDPFVHEFDLEETWSDRSHSGKGGAQVLVTLIFLTVLMDKGSCSEGGV
ncbi:family 36 putative glycoside hydrolase [Triangularia verruculosa]|uniref:Family 36 putative glycoside hydrolase n=1 Tax=Triangularia verruculosa TaxID=2587418 RepID=A0AAN6XBA5_9PEZI|nr:family 36 putative glycoside hydrolase [Triangularia verruculosa]